MHVSVPTSSESRQVAQRHRDFLKLWLGQGVSAFGSEVTQVALPLTAVLTLHAGAGQLGLLNTARWLPYLLFALVLGTYVDRLRRRPLLVAADLGRALVLGVIVASAWWGVLGLPSFIGLVFVFGTLTVLFDVTYFSYVPSLVERERLVAANSRLQATASVAGIGGPALGGVLVQLLTAPVALLVDAVSFVVSALGLLLIRSREPEPSGATPGETLRTRIREGLRITFRNPYLRALAGVAATYNFFDDWILTLFLVYAVRDLGLSAGTIGLVFAAGAVGAVLGSLLTGWLTALIGLGAALLASVGVESVVMVAVPLVPAHTALTVPVIAGAFLLNGAGVALSSVAAVSVRQSVTPEHLLGRMNASYRFISYGAIPLGAATGGLVGELIGVRAGLALGALGMVTTIGWVCRPPLTRLRTIDDAAELATATGRG